MARGGRDEDDEEQPRMTDEEVNALVAEVVRHMLFRSFQQPGVPVRREELTQIVTRSYRHQRGLSTAVIDTARKKLLSVFGMEMQELHRMPRQGNARSASSSQANPGEAAREYFLKSTVPLKLQEEFVDVPNTVALRGLALAIVSIIQLSPGGKCGEENLWSQLNKLGVAEDDETHPVFGNIKVVMDRFQRQRFFHKERSEDDGFVYSLAERTLQGDVAKQISKWIPQFVECGTVEVENEDNPEQESAESD